MGSGWWREINDREKKNESCTWLFWYEMIKILAGKKFCMKTSIDESTQSWKNQNTLTLAQCKILQKCVYKCLHGWKCCSF